MDDRTKLYMQFSLTVLVIAFMGAAWWASKVPAEAALPVITGLLGIWLPGPLSGALPRGMSLVPTEYMHTDMAAVAKSMSMPGTHYDYTRPKEIKDARHPE